MPPRKMKEYDKRKENLELTNKDDVEVSLTAGHAWLLGATTCTSSGSLNKELIDLGDLMLFAQDIPHGLGEHV
jgi:hypothetical protein